MAIAGIRRIDGHTITEFDTGWRHAYDDEYLPGDRNEHYHEHSDRHSVIHSHHAGANAHEHTDYSSE